MLQQFEDHLQRLESEWTHWKCNFKVWDLHNVCRHMVFKRSSTSYFFSCSELDKVKDITLLFVCWIWSCQQYAFFQVNIKTKSRGKQQNDSLLVAWQPVCDNTKTTEIIWCITQSVEPQEDIFKLGFLYILWSCCTQTRIVWLLLIWFKDITFLRFQLHRWCCCVLFLFPLL